MSDFRIDQITNQAGAAGPQVAGITTFNSPSGLVMPSGNTFRRSVLENVVTDGLVLYLDAGNTDSYPESGTTWADLSGYSNNGTLVNGVGYNSNNLGSLVFDGVNDYVNFNSFNFGNELTVFCFIRPSSTNTIQSIFANSVGGFNSSGMRLFINNFNTNSRSIRIEVGDGTNGGTSPFSPINTINYDVWQQVAFTLNKHTAIGTVYHNGNAVGTGSLATINYNTNASFRLGSFTDNQYLYKGRVSNYIVYNRALTPQEIQQNYNALKGRYI